MIGNSNQTKLPLRLSSETRSTHYAFLAGISRSTSPVHKRLVDNFLNPGELFPKMSLEPVPAK
jgi:hypothetical protein